jgi:predicted ester cyclase
VTPRVTHALLQRNRTRARARSLFAKENRVAVRYTAAGTHSGAARRGVEPSGKHARWSACCVFHLNESHKITHIRKDWDKLAMWHQLGWAQLGPRDLQ